MASAKRDFWILVPPAHPNRIQQSLMWVATILALTLSAFAGAQHLLIRDALIDPSTAPSAANLAPDARNLAVATSLADTTVRHCEEQSKDGRDPRGQEPVPETPAATTATPQTHGVQALTPDTSCEFAREVAKTLATMAQAAPTFQVYDASVARVREVTCSGSDPHVCTTPTGQAVRVVAR